MPIYRYKTDYPNQVHQLLISLSRHIYVSKTGEIHFQKKPFDYNLRNVNGSSKIHIVHYILKDHYSGVFYAEICTHLDLIKAEEFLYRAWSKKENFPFCGMPHVLSVPKNVLEFAPGLTGLIDALKIKRFEPTSGYQAGIREIRTWEDEINFAIVFTPSLKSFDELKNKTLELCIHLNNKGREKSSKISNWYENTEKVYLPPDLEFFKKYYSEKAPKQEEKVYEKLKFEIENFDGEMEGRFIWGQSRNEIFDRFYDADEAIDHGYERKGKSELERIIKEDPQFIDAYNSLGFLEIWYERYDKALKLFQQAYEIGIKLIPKEFLGLIIWGIIDNRPFLRAMQGLGVSHFKAGNLKKANDIFAKMLQYNPNDNQGIRALSIQSNLALEEYSKVLSICNEYPDDTMADTLYGQVLALYKIGKINEAEEKLKRAIEYLPLVAKELIKKEHTPAYSKIPGSITMGGADEAYEYWERVGKYWANDEDTLNFVKSILSKTGK